MANLSIFGPLLLLTLFVKEDYCLRCYMCDSEIDESCRDPFKGVQNPKDCSFLELVSYNHQQLGNTLPRERAYDVNDTLKLCYKIVLEKGTVIRTCLYTNTSDINNSCRLLEDYSRLGEPQNPFEIKHCSVCDSDSCNGASSISFSFTLFTLALIATYLFCKQ